MLGVETDMLTPTHKTAASLYVDHDFIWCSPRGRFRCEPAIEILLAAGDDLHAVGAALHNVWGDRIDLARHELTDEITVVDDDTSRFIRLFKLNFHSTERAVFFQHDVIFDMLLAALKGELIFVRHIAFSRNRKNVFTRIERDLRF